MPQYGSTMSEIDKLNGLFDRLWPICRSIAGPGIRKSLDILAESIPLERLTFSTGTQVFDWTVPKEWVAKDAYFVGPDGKKRAEFKKNNLSLVSHSVPFKGTMNLEELKKHLFSIPDLPQAIPYITSYYKEQWGFCLPHEELESLPQGSHSVFIDTELKPGYLVVGEAILEGKSKKEILLSTYLCHPSMANNELSGPLAMSLLYERISKLKNRRYTYRFVVSAETIGTICYLSLRGQHLKDHVIAGYQLTCMGDKGPFTFKKSRRGDSITDHAALKYLRETEEGFKIEDFDPGNGSDERQYCSPGFDLPMGSLMRTMYSRYPEYHTSLDNKDFISFESLVGSVNALEGILLDIESRQIYVNNFPFCEPQLGKRGLYPQTGSVGELQNELKAIMWILNFSDGKTDLEMIAEKSKLSLNIIKDAASQLCKSGVISIQE